MHVVLQSRYTLIIRKTLLYRYINILYICLACTVQTHGITYGIN